MATDPRPPLGTAGRTPTRTLLRRWRWAAVAACVVSGVLATLVAAATISATESIHDNTGPVMVATQSLSASLAEADAAANAAFLTDPEDPRLRNAYLDALDRATAQVEQVSALIGEDPEAHAALREVSELITRYAGLVEAARAAEELTSGADQAGSSLSDEAAVPYLVTAGEVLTDEIDRATNRLERATLLRLEDDAASQAEGVGLATGALVVAVLVLLGAQLALLRRTRRVLNLGTVVATVLVGVAAVWLATATSRASDAFAAATNDGFESIEATSDLQSSAFAAKSAYSTLLITGDTRTLEVATDAAQRVLAQPVDAGLIETVRAGSSPACPAQGCGLLALSMLSENAREDALVADAITRWGRFDRAATELVTLAASGDEERIVELATGPVQDSFNGFNFALEGVLAANQDQFLGGLDDATGALGGLLPVVLLAPLVAAGAAWAGMQARINEYR